MIIFPSPQTKTWTQPNSSDLFGSLWSVRGMNLDRPGYLELSNAGINLEGASSLIGSVIGIDKIYNTSGVVGTIFALTSVNTYDLNLKNQAYLGQARLQVSDTTGGRPVVGGVSSSISWQNRWYVAGFTQVKYYGIGGWNSTGITYVDTAYHPMEIFKTKNSLCVGSKKAINIYDTSHVLKSTLVLTEDPISIVYNNSTIGILTRSTEDQSNSFFYVWDGDSTTDTYNTVVPLGSSCAMGMCSYQSSSWVIMTSKGQLLKFNGNGFNVLAEFPWANDSRYTWTTTAGFAGGGSTYSNSMVSEGDKIYINVNSNLLITKDKENNFVETFPSGVWCYDPKVGLYHKFNNSSTTELSRGITAVNATTNIITTVDILTSGMPETGTPVKFITNSDLTTLGGECFVGETYYTISVSSKTLKLATTKQNAINNISIDLTDPTGDGGYLIFYPFLDYGTLAQYKPASDAVNFMRRINEESIHKTNSETLFTGINSIDAYTINTIVPNIETRGTVITPRMYSKSFKDIWKKINIKFSGITKDIDGITIKYKDEDVNNLPGSTHNTTYRPLLFSKLTSTTISALTVSTSFSEIQSQSILYDVIMYLTYGASSTSYTYAAGDTREVELLIVSGPSANTTSQIQSITKTGSAYTITLRQELPGTVMGQISVSFNTWKTIGDITYADTDGYKELPIEIVSKFIQFKLELRGYGVIIEEIQIINEPHTLSS